MLKASVVAAVALTLLVPTFNALNLSYVENVQPPPWMPTPKDPPNITPPTNMKPPTDFEPPDGWEGEIPPGSCPPPVMRVLNETRQQYPIDGPNSQWQRVVRFVVPNGSLAMGGYANFTQWRASSISVQLEGPQGFKTWRQEARGAANGLLAQPQPQTTPFEYNSTGGDEPSPVPAGDYTLTLQAQFPIDGSVSTIFGVALACGGMMSG